MPARKPKATEEALGELHGIVAEVLAKELTRPRGDEEGAISPAMIAQAINFLKANNISAPAGNPGLAKLVEALPFPAEGEADGDFNTTFQRH
ncbi:hypothetical protein UFOVP347_40 [uncultured Caudovirales phage]|uniref:Uncharacterized protein n=1 Tax=uncultured Caudovirales phage TaxID=2100421 RepID=A0A6J5LYH9_9CAUD|nr:hypothetical protein UFOVP347_40 [uncultured Caudovirales phage]